MEDPREGTPSRASGARASEMSAPAPARATIALANIAVREDDADDVDARALARAVTVVHDDGDVARDVVEERAPARLGHRESAMGTASRV